MFERGGPGFDIGNRVTFEPGCPLSRGDRTGCDFIGSIPFHKIPDDAPAGQMTPARMACHGLRQMTEAEMSGPHPMPQDGRVCDVEIKLL